MAKKTKTTKAPAIMPKEKRLLIAALTRADRELLIKALHSHLWSERDTLLSAARSLYLVADEHGNAKRFDGDWQALRKWARETFPGEKTPLGLVAYDRLEQEVETLIARLEGKR